MVRPADPSGPDRRAAGGGEAADPGEPAADAPSRPLGDGLHELRFSIKDGRVDQRITYIFDVERHVITLTTFPKTRNNERRQVRRARDAQADYKHGRK